MYERRTDPSCMVSQQQIQSELVTCPFLAPYKLCTITLNRTRPKKKFTTPFFFVPKCFPYLHETAIVRKCLTSYSVLKVTTEVQIVAFSKQPATSSIKFTCQKHHQSCPLQTQHIRYWAESILGPVLPTDSHTKLSSAQFHEQTDYLKYARVNTRY